MSTNKTENYQLHSWTPEDTFLRAEMNENFAKLDQAVGTLQSWMSTACVAGSVPITDEKADITVDLGFRPKLLILGMVGASYRFFRIYADQLHFTTFTQGSANPAFSTGKTSLITDTGFTLPATYMITKADVGTVSLQYVAFR